MKDSIAPRIQEWCRFVSAASKTNPAYKAKALLSVLEADGVRVLVAVLKQLKLERTEQLIEAMRESGKPTVEAQGSDR